MNYSIHSISEGGIVTNMTPIYQYVPKEQKLERQTKEVKVSVETKSNLDLLRDKYFELSGKKAHHLWKEARIEEEISKLEE